MLPHTQIFLAGDVDENSYYQCAFKDVNVINDFKNMNVIKFTNNYRCKDNKLLERLDKLRNVMKKSNFDKKEILNHVLKDFNDRITTEKELIDTYNYKQDWILVSVTNDTNKTKSQTEYYTKLLEGEKYLCIKHNKEQIYNKLNGFPESYLVGEIAYDIIPNKRFEKRHGFTIHGFQGITIKNPERLFIDTKNIFCARQLYTALSRVEYLDQIHILK